MKVQLFLLLQIHDELIYEIKEGKVNETVPKIRKIMENIISPEQISGIDLKTEVQMGDSWGEMSEFIEL